MFNSINDLIIFFDSNNIKYTISDYAGSKSVVLKNNKYKIEIYKTNHGFVRDLQSIPYTWGFMGSCDIPNLFIELNNYLKIKIDFIQLSLF